MNSRRYVLRGLSVAVMGCIAGSAQDAWSESPGPSLEAEVNATLERLSATQPAAAKLMETAKAVLVFPEIVKGGLLVGAATGKGALRVDGKTQGYYRSSAVSYGLQAGFTTFGYVMFFMDAASLTYLEESSGWEVGVGPNITVADQSITRKLTTTTVQEGVYVFFTNQEGYFAGAGIEGTKISRL